MKKIEKEAWKVYQDWEKRKSWNSDFAGSYTTPEEDEMAKIILILLHEKD